MADQNEIEFKLKTTGDVSGAEAVEKSIFKATDAAQEAQRQADVDAVKAKQAAEVQAQQAELLKALAEGQQRIIAGALAKELGNIAKGFGAISPEAKLAVEATQNFLTVAASTGDPIKAAFALVATAIGGVATAYQEAAKQAKQLEKDELASIKKMKEARTEYATFLRTQGLVDFFQKELDQLEEQERVLNRIVKINASERALAAQREATAGAVAVAGGADARGVAAQQSATNTDNQVSTLQDKLAQSELVVTNAVKKAESLELEAKALAEKGNVGSEAVRIAGEAVEARKQADQLSADLVADRVVTNNQIQAVRLAGQEALRSVAETAGKEQAAQALKEVETIKAASLKSGQAISSQAAAGMETLVKIAADGIISPEEQAKLRDALQRINSSREASDSAVKEGLETLFKGNEAFIRVIQPLTARLDAQLTRIQDLEQNLGKDK